MAFGRKVLTPPRFSSFDGGLYTLARIGGMGLLYMHVILSHACAEGPSLYHSITSLYHIVIALQGLQAYVNNFCEKSKKYQDCAQLR